MEKYEIVQLIGSGSFGFVYKVRHKTTNQIRCIKQINLISAQLNSITTELEILQKLNHENVTKCYKNFIEGAFLCIVLEYVDDSDLQVFLSNQKSQIPENLILFFLRQIVSALLYCHSLKIIHRDLKPANILLNKNGTIKLCDFGLSICLKSSTTKSMIGSPLYMSPEIVKGKSYSFPADVWSLGCVLYQMMMLKTPFESDVTFEVFLKITTEEPAPIVGDYSEELKNIVMKCLEKQPEKRITVAEIQNILETKLNSWQNSMFNDVNKQNNKATSKKQTNEGQIVNMNDQRLEGCDVYIENQYFSATNNIYEYACLIEEVNPPLSMKCYKVAADRGHVNSIFQYGLALEEGWDGSKDYVEAMKYYKLGADLDHVESLFCYAFGLHNGYLGEPNIEQAMKYYKKAANKGHFEAMYNYAVLLEEQGKDFQQMMIYYKMAADAGVVPAMFNYAAACVEKLCGSNSLREGMKYFKMASEKNDADATIEYERLLSLGVQPID